MEPDWREGVDLAVGVGMAVGVGALPVGVPTPPPVVPLGVPVNVDNPPPPVGEGNEGVEEGEREAHCVGDVDTD